MKRVRIDNLLSQRGIFPSRSRAAASVLAGDVLLLPERRRVRKPGELVPENIELEVVRPPEFVSRGGIKLANALDALGVEVGETAWKLGAAVLGYTSSGLPGPKGNLETFAWLAEGSRPGIDDLEAAAREVEP